VKHGQNQAQAKNTVTAGAARVRVEQNVLGEPEDAAKNNKKFGQLSTQSAPWPEWFIMVVGMVGMVGRVVGWQEVVGWSLVLNGPRGLGIHRALQAAISMPP